MKIAIGGDALIRKLKREITIGDYFGRITAALSFGKRRESVTDIYSTAGTAEEFVGWFEERRRINDEASMLWGTPDHYVIRTAANGSQEVVETTGGAPMTTRFLIDFDDVSSLKSQRDPSFPLQLAGVARASNGVPLGGVRHQFRNEGQGFHARLVVEFPLVVTPQVISGHRWHLASEFSNWIELSLGIATNGQVGQ